MRLYSSSVLFACLSVTTSLCLAAPGQALAPAELSIIAPDVTLERVRVSRKIENRRYLSTQGIIATTQWPLILRFESSTAVGFAASATAGGQKREALVLEDPDGCLNLSSLVEDLQLPTYDPACIGLPEDERYIEVQTEKFDTFELVDNLQTGNDAIRERLVDDDYQSGARLNTPYLALKQGKVNAVGAKTGGPATGAPERPELDGYGYGADDDFSSLVIMADVGGARVFDTDFNLLPGVIRNMAGFVNVVSAELLSGRGDTAITAILHPLAGVFEPLALFDLDISDPPRPGADYLQRIDSGPVKARSLRSTIPTASDPIAQANEFYDELLATYYPHKLSIRAVVVLGEAPDYIEDMDGDGSYTAADVRAAGYELASNQVELVVTLTHDNLLIDSPTIKCLPRSLLFADLDANGKSGEPFKCSGKSGSSRSRRVPR